MMNDATFDAVLEHIDAYYAEFKGDERAKVDIAKDAAKGYREQTTDIETAREELAHAEDQVLNARA